MLHNNKKITSQIVDFSESIGVDLIGIAPAESDPKGQEDLHRFIKDNRQGNMEWLAKDYKKRADPTTLLPGAKSIIVIAINYYRHVPRAPAGHGRVARYAYGRDYHKVLKSILKKISSYIAELTGKQDCCKICVDSAPILEKSYAVKAGLGFIGKNTTLITPEFGSFVLLGEILTTIELEPNKPRTGTCGTCTRCIDACPTQALIGPGTMDARRCISYLTIEHKGEIPADLQPKMGNWLFGCDICQEVCPYNKANAKPLQLKAFQEVKIAGNSIPLQEILDLKTDQQYLERFAGSPLMRAKRVGLQRNAKTILKNIPGSQL